MGSGHPAQKKTRPATPQAEGTGRRSSERKEELRVEQSAPVSGVAGAQQTQRIDVAQFRWQKGALIGQGSYGQVFECLNLDTGETHVVKEVRLVGDFTQIQREISSLKREILTLKALSHPHIVRYIHADVTPDQKTVQIFMEYVSGGSLRSQLDKFGKLEEGVARKYVEQLVAGLEYIHRNGVVHRDVKSDNVLVDGKGGVKLTDFGAAKKVGQPGGEFTESKSLIGSPYWMAPEVVQRVGHSYPSDIWSLGCLLIELLTGKPPWSEQSTRAAVVLQLIKDATRPPTFPGNISMKCKSFLYRCLRLEPEKRATASDLRRHPYLTGEDIPTDHLELLQAEEEAEPSQAVFQDTDKSEDQYDLVYDLDDVEMTEKKPVKQAITRVQSHKVIERVPSHHSTFRIRDDTRGGYRSQSPKAVRRVLGRETEEETLRRGLGYNLDDVVAQTRYAERVRLAEEQRRREAEVVRRTRMQAWQSELHSAALNVNY